MKKGIVAVLSALIGGGIVAIGARKVFDKTICEKQQLADKHLALYLLMNQWIKVKQQGENISDYLIKEGYKKVAIYGMNYVGQTLYEELKDSEIEVMYAIDKKADEIYSDLDVFSPKDDFAPVDAIIVTPIFFFDEIYEELILKTNADIISIDTIVHKMYK